MFLSTGPTFMLVSNGLIPELRSAGLTTFERQRIIETNPYLRGSNPSFPHHFSTKWYDFSRTAASVLRMHMLEASGMTKYCDPVFGSKLQNLQSRMISDQPFLRSSNIDMVDMTHGFCHRAERIVAEFDRLFPHRLIENQLKNMRVGETRTLSGHMYVIYFDNPTIYQIDATMGVTLQHFYPLFPPPCPPEGMEIHANVHMLVARYGFLHPTIDCSNENRFKRYILLNELINEWLPFQNPIPTMPPIGNLSIT